MRVCGDSTGSRVRRACLHSLPRGARNPALTENLQSGSASGGQSYWAFLKSLQRSGWLLSFFDDDEETAPRPSSRAPRQRSITDGPAARVTPRRPRPRRPQRSGPSGVDQQTLMVRRLGAAVALIVLIIVAVLVISGIVKSDKQQGLKSYNSEVSELARESNSQVSGPLFVALTNAANKPALDVEQQVDELVKQAQAIAARAKSLSVPGEMTSAQQNLL